MYVWSIEENRLVRLLKIEGSKTDIEINEWETKMMERTSLTDLYLCQLVTGYNRCQNILRCSLKSIVVFLVIYVSETILKIDESVNAACYQNS